MGTEHSEGSNWEKKDDKHQASITNNLMIKEMTINDVKEKEKKFCMGCMYGVCNIKNKYGNGYQIPIEFEFHLSGYIQWCHVFWILNLSHIIITSMVRLSFQSPRNNLCVIQLDGGYFLLASPLFASQSLFHHSVSCCFYEPIQPHFVASCLQLSILCFCAFFLLGTTWPSLRPQLLHHGWLVAP